MRFPTGTSNLSLEEQKLVLDVLAKCTLEEIEKGRKLWAFDNWIRQADDRKTVTWFEWIFESILAYNEAAYEVEHNL
jgi:hypothetical protein